MLIYETHDADFAESAIKALKEAGIDCHRTCGAVRYAHSDPIICVHIRDAADRRKASEILIELGAVIDDPDRLPPKWVFAVLAIAAVVLVLWIAGAWN